MLEEEEPKNWMLGGITIEEMLESNAEFKTSYLSNLHEKE